MNPIWPLLLILLVTNACGLKKKTTTQEKRVALTEEQVSQLMDQQFISCPGGDCPSAVARLFIVNFKDADKSSLCTGSLVGARLLLTNSHCIDKQSIEQSCLGFFAVFRLKEKIRELARCSRILFRHSHPGRSRQDLSNRDYALIELDRSVSATPLTIAPDGFQPQEEVYPYVVDHISGPGARIVKLTCKVQGTGPTGRDFMLKNCPAIPGNSGAPILNAQGDIAGVLFAAEETSVTETTAYQTRISAQNDSSGFSMKQILEDLHPWL